jgi:hypothetical protein
MAKEEKAPKGSGSSINLDFSEHADLLAKIRKAADDDDRPASVWLRRKLIALGTKLFE